MPADDPILTLSNVVSGYGKMTILNGTTAAIRPDAITTDIGPNGAGKSTMLVTIFGLLRIEDTAQKILDDPRIAQLFLGGGLQTAETAV